MPRIIFTHAVEDKHFESYKGKEFANMLSEVFSSFGTEVAVYVAADGSNRVAIAANIHDMNGMSAFMQSSEAASRMADNGVILPTLVLHIEAAN